MTAYVRYNGEVYPAQLSSARFYKGELYVTAKLDTPRYKVAKEVHFSSVIQFNWTIKANEAA